MMIFNVLFVIRVLQVELLLDLTSGLSIWMSLLLSVLNERRPLVTTSS